MLAPEEDHLQRQTMFVMMDSNTDIDVFMQWFQSNGGIIDMKTIGISEFPGSGRGAIALCDIPEGHTLFTLPRTLTLSTRTSPLPTLFGLGAWHAHKLHKGWVGLILCMMWEDAWAHESDFMDGGDEGQGDVQTKWGPYMHILPTTFDTPMFWSAEELEELRGTSVIDKIGRDDAERAYFQQLVPAIKTSPTLFPPSHHEKWYTLDAYHCAGSRILSRSFTVNRWTGDGEVEEEVHEGETERSNAKQSGEHHPNPVDESSVHIDDLSLLEDTDEGMNSDLEDDEEDDPSDVAMVPMADLLNARWGSENAMLFYEPLVLRMVTTKSIKQGEQILNTYGDPPNSDLLRRYGHVDLVPFQLSSSGSTPGNLEDVEMKDSNSDVNTILHLGNPSDVAEIRADLVVHVVQTTNLGSKAEDVHARIEWWLDEGEEDTFVTGLPGSESQVLHPALVSLTRLLILPESDFKSARSKGKLPTGKLKKGDVKDVQMSELLDEVFKQREGMYIGGSVEDDERLLCLAGTLPERKRHAAIVRLGEKRILRGVRQALWAMLSELGAAGRTRCGNEKDDTRRDKMGGNGGKATGNSRKRVASGAVGGREGKKARK